MSGWRVAVLSTTVMVVSFILGFGCHLIATFDPHSGEPRQSGLEVLRQDASGFFYDTMRRLFAGTQNPASLRMSQSALDTFNAHRQTLEPRCWLINVYPSYHTFFGLVLFPSGDIFEVGITRRWERWELDYFRHVGTEHFYHDLTKGEEVGGSQSQSDKRGESP